MQQTWMERDLPVLDATVAMLEDDPMVTDAGIAERTGFDLTAVRRALEALDGTYVHLGRDMSGFFVDAVTADARRAVGQWPTGESLVSQLAEGLAAAAEKEADPERKTRLRQTAGLLGGAVRDIAVEIAGRFVERAAGLG
jgi:hypothetical protein